MIMMIIAIATMTMIIGVTKNGAASITTGAKIATIEMMTRVAIVTMIATAISRYLVVQTAGGSMSSLG